MSWHLIWNVFLRCCFTLNKLSLRIRLRFIVEHSIRMLKILIPRISFWVFLTIYKRILFCRGIRFFCTQIYITIKIANDKGFVLCFLFLCNMSIKGIPILFNWVFMIIIHKCFKRCIYINNNNTSNWFLFSIFKFFHIRVIQCLIHCQSLIWII